MSDPRALLKVLIVDDEQLFLRSLGRFLRKCCNEVLLASCYDEAMELLEKNQVDVVVSDNRMPGKDGVEVLRIACQLRPSAVRIMHSAHPPENLTELIQHGLVHHFLSKPSEDELAELLTRLSSHNDGQMR